MKHWDAFKAGEAAYVDTEGDLRAAIDAACTIAYAEGRKDESEADTRWRWECVHCGGYGRVERFDEGGQSSYWETCDGCDGVGFCGPDHALLDAARSLLESADWRVGGALSEMSPVAQFQSSGISWVKTRKLAKLRDAVGALVK